MEVNYLKIIQCDFLDIFLDSVSDSWGVPTMKITDLSVLCKWENLKNRQCFKYLFAPLYIYTLTSHFIRDTCSIQSNSNSNNHLLQPSYAE